MCAYVITGCMALLINSQIGTFCMVLILYSREGFTYISTILEQHLHKLHLPLLTRPHQHRRWTMLVYNHICINHSRLQQVTIATTIEYLVGYVEECKEIWEGGEGGGEEGGKGKGGLYIWLNWIAEVEKEGQERGGGRGRRREGEEGGRRGRGKRREGEGGEGRGGREKGEREEEGGRRGRGKRRAPGTGRREEGTLHKFNEVSRLHCLQQLLWPRGEVGDNCTQVAMATAEPHTLTLNRTRSTTLLGGAREEQEGVWMKM